MPMLAYLYLVPVGIFLISEIGIGIGPLILKIVQNDSMIYFLFFIFFFTKIGIRAASDITNAWWRKRRHRHRHRVSLPESE